MSDPVPYGSYILIEELNGQGEPTGRKLTLQGATMPFVGASWTTEQTIVTDWYPGNATDATQQVLGAKELPSTWTGEWRRRLMGREPATFVDVDTSVSTIVSPHVLFETIRTFFVLSGSALRVSWITAGPTWAGNPILDREGNPALAGQDVSYALVRVGRLKTITPSFNTISEIAWSMSFEWSGTGDRTNRTPTVREQVNLVAASTQFKNNLDAVAKQISKQTIKKSFLAKTIGSLNQLASAPTKLVDGYTSELSTAAFEFEKVTSVAERFAILPQSVAGSVQNLARSVGRNSRTLKRKLERIPVELMVNYVFVVDMMNAQGSFGEYEDIAQGQSDKAYELDKAVLEQKFAASNTGQIPNDDSRGSGKGILAIHICKEGDTPNSLAIKYYQDADRGDEICKANRLPWQLPKFTKGQILLIPAVPTQRTA